MEIVVEGIGIVGGFGAGVERLSAVLVAGKSPINAVPVQTPDGAREMPVFLADTSCLDNFVPKKSLRRIDHFSRMALLGAYLALQDAGMPGIDPKGLGIVVASGYGATQTTFAFLDSFIVGNDAYPSPTHFSGSVHKRCRGIYLHSPRHNRTMPHSESIRDVCPICTHKRYPLAQGRKGGKGSLWRSG